MACYRIPLLATAILVAWPCAAAAQRFECREVTIPMRDGVKLAADLYLPANVPGPYPVVLERTPYDKNDCGNRDAQYLVRRGYAVLIVDERGRYRSEGEYYWWRDFAKDGYDAVEWAGTQEWSNGKVGTQGLSLGCHNQYQTAPTRPPHLAAMFCAQAASNPYKYLTYQGGALHLIMPTWLLTRNEMASPFRLNVPGRSGYVGTAETWTQWYTTKQQRGLDMGRSMISRMLEDIVSNPNYNEYWRQHAVDERMHEIDTPIFHYASLYDRYPLTQVRLFNGIRKQGGPRGRAGQKLLLGPWLHGAGEVTARVIGDLDFGPEAAIDYYALKERWFAYYLKGIDNGVMREPPVRVFVMGANTWRDEHEFPLRRAIPTDYFLRSGPSGSIDSLNDGLLSRDRPSQETPDSYKYDPLEPVPTIGGDLFIQPNGARDHRPADRLSLTYTTPPLDADVEITGIPRAEFYASSSAVDTDWVVTISDVHPNGYAQVLRQNLLRARFREGFEKPVPMKPGEVHRFEIEIYPIANLFKKGHRVRLTMTSSSFPKWYPNGNTGKHMDEETAGVVATNTIYHDAARPSRVVLPIVPAAKATSADDSRR